MGSTPLDPLSKIDSPPLDSLTIFKIPLHAVEVLFSGNVCQFTAFTEV